ncbi:hypothetical protein F4779DRAFT_621201 [Xylariaceae sp. FL0662B]|nr:hypothetical protein F4779DRAFT_621201 [Xylariaceae sp. FL0662B]
MPSLTKPELPSEIAAASGQLGIRSSPLFYTLDGIAVTNAKNILALSTGRPNGVLNIVSVPAAEEKRLNYAKSIFGNWKWLNEVALRHEALIQRRWSKKSPNKRRKLLLDVWSSIPLHHRPDFYHLSKFVNNDDRLVDTDAIRAACLWPHLNLEDLAKPEPLLLMFNSRARNCPDRFVNTDFDACRIGLSSLLAVPDYWLSDVSFLMQFIHRDTPETYGEIFQCSHNKHDNQDVCENPKECSEGVPVGHGLHLLHIQDWLYKFLVQCCKAILHDIPADDLISSKFPISPEPPLPSSVDQAPSMDVLSMTILEAPYRLPAEIEFTRLETVIAARLAAARDHVWSMREDPGYFSQALSEWKEHRHFYVPDLKGRPHMALLTLSDASMWDHTIHYCVGEALGTVEMWNTLLQKVSKLRSLMTCEDNSECDFCADCEARVSSDVLDTLIALDMDIDCFLKYFIQRTCEGFYSSPVMRPVTYREEIKGDPHRFNLRFRKPPQPGTAVHKLQYILDYICARDKIGPLDLGRKVFLDELEIFLKKEPEAKKLFSPWTSSHLADVYLFAQCSEQLRLFLLSQVYGGQYIQTKVDSFEKDELKRYPTLARLQNYAWCHGLSSSGTPTNNQIRYPINKPRSKKNTEIMIMAEEQLDTFWQDLQRSLTTKGIMTPLLAGILSQPGVQRTKPWVEPEHTPSHVVNNHFESSFVVPGVAEVTNLRSEISHPTRVKPKTRGVSDESYETVDQGTDTELTETPECRFKLSSRALNVFKTLLYDDSGDTQQGRIPWKDFLFAMTSMGFASEKIFGSAWHFQPTDETMHRSIQFHEPHPTPQLSYVVAKRYGRRLNRAFGWTGDMFELA